MALIAWTAQRAPVGPRRRGASPKPTSRACPHSQEAFAAARSQGKHIRRQFCSSQLSQKSRRILNPAWSFPAAASAESARGVKPKADPLANLRASRALTGRDAFTKLSLKPNPTANTMRATKAVWPGGSTRRRTERLNSVHGRRSAGNEKGRAFRNGPSIVAPTQARRRLKSSCLASAMREIPSQGQ